MPEVVRYVKNQNLGFTIPYTLERRGSATTSPTSSCASTTARRPTTCSTSSSRSPGEHKKEKAAKVATARDLWVPAVNNHGGFGRWAFLEITDPWDAENTDPRARPPAAAPAKAEASDGSQSEEARRAHARRGHPPHGTQRANIPTEELRDFVDGGRERARRRCSTRATRRSTRSSSGRARTSRTRDDLEVPVVPIYIQEKIRPAGAHREPARHGAQGRARAASSTLFDDFDGIEFEELVDFYHHEQNWANRMILGDSLLVMTSPGREGGPQGQGPDDLPRPALRHQVRLATGRSARASAT